MSTAEMERSTETRRWVTPTVAVTAAALTLLALGFWWVAPWKTARPIMVTGTAYTNGSQTSISFTADSWLDRLRFGLQDTGFEVGDVSWASTDTDLWHADDGPVECLTPVETTRVESATSRWPTARGMTVDRDMSSRPSAVWNDSHRGGTPHRSSLAPMSDLAVTLDCAARENVAERRLVACA